MPRHPIQIVPALLLLLAANGCVVIPVPRGRWADEERWEQLIGAADSSAPVKVGVSDRADVYEALGEPYPTGPGRTRPENVWQYGRHVVTGYWIWLWPLVHGGPIQPIHHSDGLAIWFGPDGRVRRFDTWSEGQGEPRDVAGEGHPTSLPATRP